MLIIKELKKMRIIGMHLVRNRIKRASLFPFGFRAKSSTSIAWSVSADGGGGEGRILVGNHSILDIGVILRAYGSCITIGDNCSINPYCMIHGGGGIEIGNGVRIASHTVIVAANHIFDESSKFIFTQGETKQGIVIEDDVWIGAGVKILDGVVVRRGTVIGAGAVVTKSTPAYSIVVGIPARVTGNRMRQA